MAGKFLAVIVIIITIIIEIIIIIADSYCKCYLRFPFEIYEFILFNLII
jgi:hypothetical protein